MLVAASCSGPKGWSVSGNVAGLPQGSALAIEANNGNSWYVIDSVSVADNGSFTYSAEAPVPYADIMRLTLPDKGSIYFPVDSVDAVSITADAANYGVNHKLAGTGMAEIFGVVDSIVAATPEVDDLRKKLVNFITTDTTGLVAYYVVSKAKGATPVFNSKEPFGNRVYGAAAQVFATYRPLDVRGQALKRAYFEGRMAMGHVTTSEETVLEASEAGLIDITRYDDKGVSHSLAEIAGKKGPVILSLTDYGSEVSPAYNALLFDIYNKYKDRGLEIYQLAFDGNEVSWKEAARNLPWITVWNAPTDGVGVLMQYNVGALPLTYIIDRNGDIGARVTDPDQLEKTVARYL